MKGQERKLGAFVSEQNIINIGSTLDYFTCNVHSDLKVSRPARSMQKLLVRDERRSHEYPKGRAMQ